MDPELEKLLTRVPGQGAYLSAEVYRIMVRLNRLRLLAPKRQMSDEQRAQIGQNFRNAAGGREESTSISDDEYSSEASENDDDETPTQEALHDT